MLPVIAFVAQKPELLRSAGKSVETQTAGFPLMHCEGFTHRIDPGNRFCKERKDIGVIKEYDTMSNFLSTLKNGRVLVADSHKEIEKFFSEIKPDEELEIINIDFHHDMFVTGGNNLDCGIMKIL